MLAIFVLIQGEVVIQLGIVNSANSEDDNANGSAKKQALIGIYSQNNPKWMIAAEGAWMYRIGIVPLYDTLGSTASSFIINQAKTALVIVDTASKVFTR